MSYRPLSHDELHDLATLIVLIIVGLVADIARFRKRRKIDNRRRRGE